MKIAKKKTQKKHYRKIEKRKQSKSIGGCQNWGPKWTKIDRRWGAYCAKMGQNRSVTKRNLLDIDRRREGILVEKEKIIENCKEKNAERTLSKN